ncbi:DUF4139 domain-containing protein [Pendulispora rubella]|uniref:DUF4139 domain-containing protein n=1 Tax=Pendulispora rubella TaxID=2741070 RepID=A0ABZ2L3M6_9BACT
MRQLAPFSLIALLVGCGGGSSYVHSDTTLGRVVVYRNGVAYFERYAKVDDEALRLSVPADKVDDFLKSLTVVDAKTGQPAPVAYPTGGSTDDSGFVDMKIGLPGSRPHQVRLSYVTDAPAWKPSYRVLLGQKGQVELQAWAIVDNTSGEDWHNVQLGVGSSSAMSFRFDLRSLRMVQRETLQSDALFAAAPPSGASVYGGTPAPDGQKNVAVLTDDAIATTAPANSNAAASPDEVVVAARAPTVDVGSTSSGSNSNADYTSRIPLTNPGARGGAQRSFESVGGGGKKRPPTSSGMPGSPNGSGEAPKRPSRESEEKTASAPPPPPPAPPPNPFDALLRRIRQPGNTNAFVIEGFADPKDGDRNRAALDRANRVREQLIRQGADPNRITAVGKGEVEGTKGGVRVLEAPKVSAPGDAATAAAADPIGTSHFESGVTMSIPRGSSAMVSILNKKAEGEVVYLYDPESARGNGSFAFKSVRIKNPTDSALESGPVSVFGEGRFIGEGIAEPIPAKSTAFVPFALDRQIVVEAKNEDRDQIARVLTVQRGVFSAEVQHTKRSTWTLHNRLRERVTVYVRHTSPEGYKLSPSSAPSVERIGGANLFRVILEGGAKKDIVVEEQAPQFRTVDLRSPDGMSLVRSFLSTSALESPLRSEVTTLLNLQQEIGNIEQRITTVRDQMQEYRSRMDELHAQIVTLRAVKTAGPLMQNLQNKLQDVSDHMSKSTIEVVALQEKLMVSRIRFQDGVADLSLGKKSEGIKSSENAKTK